MAGEPFNPWQSGEVFSREKYNEDHATAIRRVVAEHPLMVDVVGDTATIRGVFADGESGGGLSVEITALANNYVTVKRVDPSGTAFGDAFDVAKPWKLRHIAGQYDGVTSISTIDTNTMNATTGTDTEEWVVSEPYKVGDHLTVRLVTYTGVTGVLWEDTNNDNRKWLTDCVGYEGY